MTSAPQMMTSFKCLKRKYPKVIDLSLSGCYCFVSYKNVIMTFLKHLHLSQKENKVLMIHLKNKSLKVLRVI